jgi:hypothetical protein
MLYGIGFLSAHLGGAEIGFFQSVFLVPITILGIVHGIHTHMLLAEVAMLLGASFLGNLVSVSFLALQEAFLLDCALDLAWVHNALNSLERQEKQIHVQGSYPFLV